jgi:glucosamine--fructose-6-phosphate aminotransferase (isomerizing)
MCGIIGYIGNKKAVPALIEGLKGLEYRGYDSAGIAYLNEGSIRVHRSVGKLVNLETALRGISPDSRIGIGHTRWATHGKPTEENAHPHQVGGLVLVHNGIIENYVPLKQELQNEGHRFLSETDTEVIVHLIDRELKRGGDFEDSVRAALGKVRGSYAICVMYEREPEKLIAARNGCPLVVGLGQEEYLVSSDIPPILNHTREVLVVEDGEMVVIGPKGAAVKDLAGGVRDRKAQTVSWTPVMAQKAGYRHFMLKEIFEQPQAILDTFRGRVFPESGEVLLPEIGLSDDEIAGLQKITLVACGTSYHAGLVGKFFIEKLAGIPVEVDIGSEFRYREPILSPGILLVAVSQSGETADTLAALKEARRRGARTLSVCNVVGSTMSRESDGVIYTHAGPEIGVAATKTFTAQLTALYLLGIFLGAKRGVTDRNAARGILTELLTLPGLVESALTGAGETERLAKLFFKYRDFLYMGRGVNYPIALEGALKLKELSYIHAEGYPAGEMKHGPIALIDENVPIVVLAPEGKVYEKILGNVMEVKARGGVVVAVATEGDREIGDRVEHALYVPAAPALLTPVVLSVPLQLLAYHIAVLRGCDVDQPRNLAKSVTVE